MGWDISEIDDETEQLSTPAPVVRRNSVTTSGLNHVRGYFFVASAKFMSLYSAVRLML